MCSYNVLLLIRILFRYTGLKKSRYGGRVLTYHWNLAVAFVRPEGITLDVKRLWQVQMAISRNLIS
jgi:hypothetical protein